MPHDVFISYGREDSAIMQRVDHALKDAGLTTWTDHGIHAGSPSWKVDIETAIQDARCIVVLFSPDSAESRWVRAELDYAEAQHKPIYPLLVRGDKGNAVPFGFTSYQWIDVRDSSGLEPGLERLIAALKGDAPVLPDNPPAASIPFPAPRRVMIPVAIGMILAGLILGAVLILSIPQTVPTATATATLFENAAAIQPTTLPTMPSFVMPNNFKTVEGDKAQIAVPVSWSTGLDRSIMSATLLKNTDRSSEQSELMKMLVANIDIMAIDLLHAYGVVTITEDLGFPISYDLLKTRQEELFKSYDPKGKYTSAEFVEMPAGTMLYAKGTGGDNNTFINDYVLMRGSKLYHIMLSGKLADREKIEQIGQQIATSFRVKE